MTCVIALKENGVIWMGGDSAATSQWDVRQEVGGKVFRVDDMLIGYTASFRMGQLLQYHLKDSLPPNKDRLDTTEYMVRVFVPVVRELFSENGYATVSDNEERGGQFTVGYMGKIYEIQSDYSVLEYSDTFNAIGIGTQYALGAMRALEYMPPKKRIRESLKIAARFANGVRGPFHIIKLKRKNNA